MTDARTAYIYEIHWSIHECFKLSIQILRVIITNSWPLDKKKKLFV